MHLSIDIGGTKVRVVEYDGKWKEKSELVLRTDDFFDKKSPKGLEKLFGHLRKTYSVRKYGRMGLSINCPVKNNKVVFSSLLGGAKAKGLELKKLAAKYFHFEKFFSDNDVYCMAKAEVRFGAAKSRKSVMLVNLGTGIRVVNIEEKKILKGYQDCAGEISLSEIHFRGKMVRADDLLAGKGFANIAKEVLGAEGEAMEIMKKKPTQIIELFTDELARFLQTSSYFYNPELIVFAGGFLQSSKHWFGKLEKKYFNGSLEFLMARKLLISKVKNPASLGAILEN